MKNFATGDSSLTVLQWQLLTNIKQQKKTLDFTDETIRWILGSRETLKNVLTSGDVQGNKWKEVIEIVAEIIRQDANAKIGLKNKLAVAIF